MTQTATATDDWQATARELRETGLSERQIAASVGKAASTVHAFFKREGIEAGEPTEPEAPLQVGDDVDDEAAGEQPSEPAPEDLVEPSTPWTDDPAEPPAPPSSNGNGHLSPYHAERIRLAAETGQVPGQTDVFGGEVSEVYVEEIRVVGSTQLALDFGGKLAQSATLTLGGSVEVDGFFKKGETIRFEGVARVVGVGGKDKLDRKTGIVVEAVQTHAAKIVDLRVKR